VTNVRQRVEAGVIQVERLSSQMSVPRPIEVLAHLAELLPAKGVLLRELDLNGLRVRMDLELDATVSRSMVIAALQRSPWFSDIAEVRDIQSRGGVPFEFRLRQAARKDGMLLAAGMNAAETVLRMPAAASASVTVLGR
jgi:hypothetical protein